MEQPRLRVKPRRASLVRHLHLPTHLDQGVERSSFRRYCIGRRDNTKLMSPLAMRTELRQQEPEAVPTNEGAQQVDAVRGWYLSLERVADRRLSASVDEEIAGGKRHVWTVRKPRLTESPINGFRDGQE